MCRAKQLQEVPQVLLQSTTDLRSLSVVTAVRTRLPQNSCTRNLSRADSSGARLWQTWCSLSREESSSRGQRLFSAPVDPILTLPLRLNSALITDRANGSSSQCLLSKLVRKQSNARLTRTQWQPQTPRALDRKHKGAWSPFIAGSNQLVDHMLCRLCAADIKCSAYNWASNAVADPQLADKVFLCHKLHDVHPGVDGWELGVRT